MKIESHDIGGAVVGATCGVLYAASATTTVFGATAVSGAISTATITTSAGTMIASKVAMGLFGKIIVGTAVAVFIGVASSILIKLAIDEYNQTTENN
jgi:hypothetical protein